MSQDVKLERNSEGVFDLVAADNDLDTVSGLETAILVSLFTDARADSGEVPDAYNRRGWVGNLLRISDNYVLGSVLWLLSQARLDQNTLNRGVNFAYNCLLWMIITGLAESVEVNVTQESTRGALFDIKLFKARNLIARYTTLWRSTGTIG